jgi:integrase
VSRRKVPFHPILLQLDLPSHVKRVREQGANYLFPHWKPSRGKASSEAEKWFRGLLRDIGLRDETPGACVLGMHVFRHTLITRARDLGLNVQAITGHAKDQNGVDHKSEVVRGYEGKLPLEIKKRTLDAITFDIEFVKPAHLLSQANSP